MSRARRGQTLVEVLTTAVLLGIILIGSVTGYRNYAKGDEEIRTSILSASLDSSFSQLSKDPYLLKEMFLDEAKNSDLKSCLSKGTCPAEWKALLYDREKSWPYAQANVSFDFRSKNQDIVEIRMQRNSRRPLLIWLSRYDYLNIDAKLTLIACPHRHVINGIDFMRGEPICIVPTPPPSVELRR
jgi:hypothetical protein